MARLNKSIPTDPTTGFGSLSRQSGNRFYSKDGNVNITRKGVRLLDRFSWFHTMISMPAWKFWLSLCSAYLLMNLLFAFVYFGIGVEHFSGIEKGSSLRNFSEAFFFSAQTLSTVGYGHVSPSGFLASAVAAFEAFLGVLSFALASGLFYGRFSKPRPFLYFSDVALLSPYKEGKALMFRTVPYKNNHLTDAEVRLTLALRVVENGVERNVFYPLNVEFSRINYLVLNWTIVHPITEESPMYGLSMDDLREGKAELMVILKAYDEVFANTVVARTSYIASEMVEDARFRPMYHSSPTGATTVLEVDQLNAYDLLNKA